MRDSFSDAEFYQKTPMFLSFSTASTPRTGADKKAQRFGYPCDQRERLLRLVRSHY